MALMTFSSRTLTNCFKVGACNREPSCRLPGLAVGGSENAQLAG